MKDPVVSREALFNPADFRYLDFQRVETALGPMIESRPVIRFDGTVPRLDSPRIDYVRRTPFNPDSLFTVYGTGGQQVPTDWDPATEPGQ